MHYMVSMVRMDIFNQFLEIGIPYTHSGVIASAKAMDKEISKKLFLKHKILTPNI